MNTLEDNISFVKDLIQEPNLTFFVSPIGLRCLILTNHNDWLEDGDVNLIRKLYNFFLNYIPETDSFVGNTMLHFREGW